MKKDEYDELEIESEDNEEDGASMKLKDILKEKLLKFWKGWGYSIAIAFVIAMSFRSAIAEFNDVPTGSMKPTILEGDRLFVNKIAYDLKIPFTTRHILCWDNPKRGEIVVFSSPEDGKRLVKRVIGVPGDSIAMRGNRLFINKKPVTYEALDHKIVEQIEADQRSDHMFFAENIGDEKHAVMFSLTHPSIYAFGPITVPDDHYFMMGDNRDNSADSRYFGFVNRKLILGRAVGIFISLKIDEHYLPRWERFFQELGIDN